MSEKVLIARSQLSVLARDHQRPHLFTLSNAIALNKFTFVFILRPLRTVPVNTNKVTEQLEKIDVKYNPIWRLLVAIESERHSEPLLVRTQSRSQRDQCLYSWYQK